MAKEISAVVKLQIEAGKANPAPPVGTALGPRGVNIMGFCKEFNDRTKGMTSIVPVVITVYRDKSFDFILKSAPVAYMIKEAAGIEAGSKEPARVLVGKITKSQAVQIAKKKMQDMTSASTEAAVREIIGAARSMGVEVIDD